jgi:nucleoredoxin
VHFDDDQLEQKKYFLFFFSANWSPTGRKFTPTLVDYYNRVTAQHPEVEVIFFSVDRSQFGMETYLSLCNMPWPAVEFSKIAAKSASMDTKLVRDIPALILVTSNGKVLSQTASGDHEKSAEQVLADLDGVLTGRQPTQVARAH